MTRTSTRAPRTSGWTRPWTPLPSESRSGSSRSQESSRKCPDDFLSGIFRINLCRTIGHRWSPAYEKSLVAELLNTRKELDQHSPHILEALAGIQMFLLCLNLCFLSPGKRILSQQNVTNNHPLRPLALANLPALLHGRRGI